MGMNSSRLRVTIRSTSLMLAGAMVAVLLGVGAIARAQAAGARADAVDRLQAIEEARLQALVNADTGTAGIMARLSHEGWITELYELRNGRWHVVWEQATAVPNDFGLFVESLKLPS